MDSEDLNRGGQQGLLGRSLQVKIYEIIMQ